MCAVFEDTHINIQVCAHTTVLFWACVVPTQKHTGGESLPWYAIMLLSTECILRTKGGKQDSTSFFPEGKPPSALHVTPTSIHHHCGIYFPGQFSQDKNIHNTD
jgi:hypothetical protein